MRNVKAISHSFVDAWSSYYVRASNATLCTDHRQPGYRASMFPGAVSIPAQDADHNQLNEPNTSINIATGKVFSNAFRGAMESHQH